jgi:hypothetical protein
MGYTSERFVVQFKGCIKTIKTSKKVRNIIIKGIKEIHMGEKKRGIALQSSSVHLTKYPIQGRRVNTTAKEEERAPIRMQMLFSLALLTN